MFTTYQSDTHHLSSLAIVMPSTPHKSFKRRYSQIYRSLGRAELQQGASTFDEFGLDELINKSSNLILGYYTPEGLEFGLREYGLFDDLQSLGYESLELQTRREDHEDDLIRIRSTLPDIKEPLIELVSRRSILTLHDELKQQLGDRVFSVLHVEWLQLQHPMEHFSPERPPLPGQEMPGLGLSRQIFELLRNVCRRLKLDALVTTPSYYHNAVFYQLGFSYLDPRYQAKLEAMKRNFTSLFAAHFPDVPDHLAVAIGSWSVQWGHTMVHTYDHTQRADWFHEPMVSPITRRIKEYLNGNWYRQEVDREMQERSYTWLDNALTDQLAQVGLLPYDPDSLQTFLSEPV